VPGGVPVLGGRGSRRGELRRLQRLPVRAGDDPRVDVSGLSFINVVHIPGNVLASGSWQVVSFVDDRASDA
jgi:hypothetical protein